MRKAVSSIPDGVYSFTDFLDDDGLENSPVKIMVKLSVKGEKVRLDFTGTSPQVAGSVNAVRSITLSAVLYVFRSLLDEGMPTNSGSFRPLEVITPPGSLVNAQFPAAVAGGNVETSQRIVDVLLGVLAQAVPERIPAASQGTMNNITMGGINPRDKKPFAYYETLGGGMGAGPWGGGESGVHSHMTNTLNTPVEALEYSYPFIMREYSIRRGSGGQGKFRGGEGLIRELEVLADVEITLLSDRRKFSPYGLAGGKDAKPGRNVIIRKDKREEMPGKFSSLLTKGDVLRIETPGGGGWGDGNVKENTN